MKRLSGKFAPTALVLAAALASGAVHATENFDLRYAPGIGGADMSAPVEPGLYLQVPAWHYHGSLESTLNTPTNLATINPALAGLTANTVSKTNIKVDVTALLPRLTYMSTTQLWGATVGYTALLPLIQKKSTVGLDSVSTTYSPVAPPAPFDTLIAAGAAQTAATNATNANGSNFGVGDLEVGVMLRWQKDENQVLVVPNLILPTGKYSKTDALNGVPSPGMGKFWTFRPTVQFSHIGDGWDFGVRSSLSFNTKNTDTDYRSGNYLNVDWALMKDLPNQFRVGLQGYVIQQLTDDSYSGSAAATPAQEATLVGKGRAFAVGPAVSWIKGAGELLVEGKWLKEVDAANRPKADSFWISVSKPFL